MTAREAKSPGTPRRASEVLPIVNKSGLKATSFPWQMKPPQDSRVIVVKGTFTIVPNERATVASEQEMPSGDRFYEDNLEGSLFYPSDLAIFKPKADVLLVGHAYWSSKPTDARKALPGVGYVDFEFSSIRRSIAVFGDRSWEKAGSPAPFDQIPLRYERAFGGVFSHSNPVGRGHKTGVIMPNLEDPHALVHSPKDTPVPACLGPIAPGWHARRDKLGTYNGRWLKTNWPYFPEDFDWSYFQAAPSEQQIARLTGDETFVLGGVHPEHRILRGALPNVKPRAFVQLAAEAGGAFFEVTLRNDTVWFDPDSMKIILVWRGVFDTQDDESSEVAQLFVLADETHPTYSIETAQTRLATELALTQSSPPAMDSTAANDPRAAVQESLTPLGMRPLSPPPNPSREAVLKMLVAGENLAGRDLSGIDLSEVDLTDRNLKGTILKGAKLRGTKFDGACLEQAVLDGADASLASFQGANLNQADFTGATLLQCNFSKATLHRAVFASCVANEARFDEASGEGAIFTLASLRRARFGNASLKAIDLTGSRIDRAEFSKALLDQARFYDCRGEGAVLDGAQLEGARCDGAFLAGASLVGVRATDSQWANADLSKATFQGAHLEESNFSRARAVDANFNKIHGQETRFKKAILTGTTFLKANLMHSSFQSADLVRADFRGSNLYEVNMWKAKLENARFDAAILHGTKLAL